jgi:hypothetical protein
MVVRGQSSEEPLESARRRGSEAAAHFFVVSTGLRCWYVSTTMARFIESELDRLWAPAWISFVDLSGSRVRILASQIRLIEESASEQRAFDRAVGRQMDREAEGECDPEF